MEIREGVPVRASTNAAPALATISSAGSPPAAAKPQWQNAGRRRLPPTSTSRPISAIGSARSASNAAQLTRAKTMMQQMGSAAWFIIDNNENFEWANAIATKGEVYGELIHLCNNEISMAISGAIIGQDTKNGNRSKDESAQDILWQIVQADMEKVEQIWNAQVIPALQKIGWLKGDIRFQFDPSEDLEQLFQFATGLLPYKNIDNQWLEDKFGVTISGDKTPTDTPEDKALKLAQLQIIQNAAGGQYLV